jgi:hypothetical protein
MILFTICRGRPRVKVYRFDGTEYHLIGRADVPDEGSPVYEMPLFGPVSVIVERFTISAVTHLRPGSTPPLVERALVLADEQRPEILPGWQPLAS